MDYLLDLEPRYVAPEYASITESAWAVMEDAELSYNEMMQSIALEELAVLEAEGEPMSDEKSGEKAKGKIITWLENAWQAIKGFFEKAWRFISEKVSNLKAKMTRFDENKIKKYVNMLDSNDKKGNKRVFGTYYEYTNLEKYTSATGEAWKALTNFESSINNTFKFYNSLTEKDDVTSVNSGLMADKMSDAKIKLLETIGLPKDGTEAHVQKKVKEIIRGKQIEMDLAFVKSHINDMLETCKDPKKIVKDTKKMYNDLKKSYNTSIAEIKKCKKTTDPRNYSTYLPYLKFGKNFSTAVASAVLSCAKDKMFSDMKVVMRIQSAINKSGLAKENSDKKATNESTMMESSVFTTELRSLFDF